MDGMDCDVVREALSARIDGEREPVPSARVDEHLESCRGCAAWYADAQRQAAALRVLAVAEESSVQPVRGLRTAAAPMRWGRRYGLRVALAVAGLVQIWVAVAQAAGMNFGLVAAHHDHHGAATGAHLLNESTAWSAALGLVTVAAAFLPPIAAGLASVLVAYVGLLSCYVVADAVAGQVTTIRIASHLPVVAAAALAVLVWFTSRRATPPSLLKTDPAPFN